MAVNGMPELHLTKVVFLAPGHYNYVGTCISQFFKRSQKFVFLGETASLKFGASI